jgi:anti-sigma regulatory factor (Ser/Thr protein kinase)
VAPTSATRAYPLDPTSAGQARAWCREHLALVLAAQPHRAGLVCDVVTVVSELVTNALQAGSPRTVLTLRTEPAAVTVAVTDSVAGLPKPRHAGPTDASGRGLAIVSALASDWGVTQWGIGKTVWAEVPLAAVES